MVLLNMDRTWRIGFTYTDKLRGLTSSRSEGSGIINNPTLRPLNKIFMVAKKKNDLKKYAEILFRERNCKKTI